jgi:NAD-dependent DNA ligase
MTEILNRREASEVRRLKRQLLGMRREYYEDYPAYLIDKICDKLDKELEFYERNEWRKRYF